MQLLLRRSLSFSDLSIISYTLDSLCLAILFVHRRYALILVEDLLMAMLTRRPAARTDQAPPLRLVSSSPRSSSLFPFPRLLTYGRSGIQSRLILYRERWRRARTRIIRPTKQSRSGSCSWTGRMRRRRLVQLVTPALARLTRQTKLSKASSRITATGNGRSIRRVPFSDGQDRG